MADTYTLAIYCFAAYGFFKILIFILKGSMDEGMSLLRKWRECRLEIKSWKTGEQGRALPESQPKT